MRSILLCLLFLVAMPLSAQTCKTQREVFIENATTKVWKTTLCPHEKLPFHQHDYARVLIPEEDGQLKAIYKSGKEVTIDLHKKVPIFLDIAQGKELHQDENTKDIPLHMMLIEFRQ
jgi:hypothetical protein